jgi:hypothetical protein|eukprot:COSAG01_NODE_4344_length_5117_cov_29.590674_2_plen_34_part_00
MTGPPELAIAHRARTWHLLVVYLDSFSPYAPKV